jgi:hypothetical protein
MVEPRIEQKPETLEIPVTGPGITSTLDKPLDPRAIKAYNAMIRKDHLADKRRRSS